MWIIKRFFFKRRLRFALGLLSTLEGMMKQAGIPRQQRRFFWREMSDDESREKAIKRLAKELNVK